MELQNLNRGMRNHPLYPYTPVEGDERQPQPEDTTRPSTPHLKDVRTYVLIICFSITMCSNVLVLYYWIKTQRFGISITDGRWRYIDDGNAIAILGVWAQVLQIFTMLLGGWAISQLWSRQVIDKTEGGTLAELQAMGIFTSAGALAVAWIHLFQSRFSSGNLLRLMIPLLIAAFVLQYYATAFLTLVVPTFHDVTSVRSIYAQPREFMSQPAAGTPCMNLTSTNLDVCLGSWYLGTAVQDVLILGTTVPESLTYDGNQIPYGRSPFWGISGPNKFSTVLLTGLNVAVANGVIESHDFTDSIAYTANVPAIVPTLISQCALVNQTSNLTDITIADTTYRVPMEIPLLDTGFSTGQVTVDDNTLILSFSSDRAATNIHCAVNLSLSDGISSTMYFNSRMNHSGRWFNFYGHDPDILNTDRTLGAISWWPIATFAKIWLLGMGWDHVPSQNAMSIYMSTLDLSIGTRPNFTNTASFSARTYEAYSLFMLASGVNQGFPPWQNVTSHALMQSYTLHKSTLLIGARTKTRYVACAVVSLDSLFILWCFVVILWGKGWLPDWSDPVLLISTAIWTEPIEEFKDSTGGNLQEKIWDASLTKSWHDGKLVFGLKS